MERLLEVLRHQVLRMLEKRGALSGEGPEDARQAYQAQSLHQRFRWTGLDVRPGEGVKGLVPTVRPLRVV